MTNARDRTFTIPGVGAVKLSDPQLLALASGRVELSSDDPTVRVLRQIADGGPYHSSVTLLSDLWDDMVWEPFLETILRELNQDGLIVYSLVKIIDSDDVEYANAVFTREVPSRIRITPKGGDSLGLARHTVLGIQHRYGFVPPPKGHWVDFTRFYHHPFEAPGGEIEREPIGIHLLRYPTHVHDLEGIDMTLQRMPEQKVTEIARKLQNDEGLSNALALKKARRIILENEPPIPDDFSLKEAIMEAMRRINSLPGSSSDLIFERLKAAGYRTNIQSVLSALWDLQKLQLVAFKEVHDVHGSRLAHVRLTYAAKKKAAERAGVPMRLPNNPRPQGSSSKSGRPVVVQPAQKQPEVIPSPLPQVSEPVSTPVPQTRTPDPIPQNMKAPLGVIGETRRELNSTNWPHLYALLERAKVQEQARERASKLLEAATLIAEVDAESADRLMARAQEIEGDHLNDEQKEMVKFLEGTVR